MPDSSKALDNWEHYVYARDHGHREFVEKATKCEQFVYGKHWDPKIIKMLKNKPALTINMIFSSLMVMDGEQIMSAADIGFLPTASGTQETADALSKLWLHISKNNKLKWIEEEVFNAGAIAGRGYFDIRMSFDDHMRGDVKITRPKSKNIVLPPDGDSYDSNEWNEVFQTYWKTPIQIGKDYNNEAAAKALAKRKASAFPELGYDSIDHLANVFGKEMSYGPFYEHYGKMDDKVRRFVRVIERQYRDDVVKEHFVDRITGDMRVVPDTWDREKIAYAMKTYDLAIIEKKASKFFWTITADDIVLFDAESPYDCVTIVPYFPYFHDGETIGLIENLISPQELLNKASSQELHIVNTTANSGWKIKTGSLTNMEIEELEIRGAETGLVLELDDIKNAEKINPNQVPTGLDRIAFKAEENLKEISGISDSKRGFDRADVAAKAILAKQKAGSINLTVPLNNLIRTRHMVAERSLKLIQKYYTEERAIAVTGTGLNAQSELLVVNQPQPDGTIYNDLTVGEYQIVVTDVPRRDNFEDQIFSEAVQLRELGVQIPDAVLIEASHLPNKKEVADQVRQLQGGGEASEAEKQMAQLELQLKQLEAEEKQAIIMQKKADAALQMIRAQKESVIEEEGGNNAAELQKMEIEAGKLRLEKQKVTEELQLQREKVEGELELAREKLRNETAIQRQEIRERNKLRQLELEEKQRASREKANAGNDKD